MYQVQDYVLDSKYHTRNMGFTNPSSKWEMTGLHQVQAGRSPGNVGRVN